MSDLLTVLGDTLDKVKALETRRDETEAFLERTRAGAVERHQALAKHEAALAERARTAQTALEGLEREIHATGDTGDARFGRALQEVGRQVERMRARQAATRDRLAALRGQMGRLANQVEGVRTGFQGRLAALRTATTAVFTAEVASVDDTTEALDVTLKGRVGGLRTRLAELSAGFQKELDGTLLPRMEEDAQGFVRRLEALAVRIEGACRDAHAETAKASENRLQSFRQGSETDWKGGRSSDVAGAAAELAGFVEVGGRNGRQRVEECQRRLQAARDRVQKATSRFEDTLGKVHQESRDLEQTSRQMD